MSDVKYAGQAPLASPLYLQKAVLTQGGSQPLECLRTVRPKSLQSGHSLYFIACAIVNSMLDLRPNRAPAQEIPGYGWRERSRDNYVRRRSAMRGAAEGPA